MPKLLHILAFAAAASTAFAQVGGGSAAFGQRQSGVDAARANELAKRNMFKDETGRFLDADVLMNVQADEYVAVFGISQEGKTLEEASAQTEAVIRSFLENLKAIKIGGSDVYVDFVAQNRIYGYQNTSDNVAREVLTGFEVKKNVAVHYRDKAILDRLIAGASKAGIFDLVKVDYLVKDIAAVRSKLMEEAARVVRRKAEEAERLLGVKIGQFTQVYPAQMSTYFPTEMYDSYVAQEGEDLVGYRNNQLIQRARKPRTFYYNGLSSKDFDSVINPVLTEPSVQFTLYLRVKY